MRLINDRDSMKVEYEAIDPNELTAHGKFGLNAMKLTADAVVRELLNSEDALIGYCISQYIQGKPKEVNEFLLDNKIGDEERRSVHRSIGIIAFVEGVKKLQRKGDRESQHLLVSEAQGIAQKVLYLAGTSHVKTTIQEVDATASCTVAFFDKFFNSRGLKLDHEKGATDTTYRVTSSITREGGFADLARVAVVLHKVAESKVPHVGR